MRHHGFFWKFHFLPTSGKAAELRRLKDHKPDFTITLHRDNTISSLTIRGNMYTASVTRRSGHTTKYFKRVFNTLWRTKQAAQYRILNSRLKPFGSRKVWYDDNKKERKYDTQKTGMIDCKTMKILPKMILSCEHYRYCRRITKTVEIKQYISVRGKRIYRNVRIIFYMDGYFSRSWGGFAKGKNSGVPVRLQKVL